MRPASSTTVVPSSPWSRRGWAKAQLLEEKEARRRFAALLQRAFPGCRSENEMCEIAAVALECSPSMVRNWLRLTHDAKLTTVLKVLVIAGAEIVLRGEGEPCR